MSDQCRPEKRAPHHDVPPPNHERLDVLALPKAMTETYTVALEAREGLNALTELCTLNATEELFDGDGSD